jgi:hypothetical protein
MYKANYRQREKDIIRIEGWVGVGGRGGGSGRRAIINIADVDRKCGWEQWSEAAGGSCSLMAG